MTSDDNITARSADIKALSSTIIALIAAEKWRDNMTIEGNQMNITADEIRKAALELIGEMAQGEYECIGADGLSAKVTIGCIVGAKDFAEKMIEMIEEGEAE